MLCRSRSPRWSPPQPRRRLLKVCGGESSVLASTLATTKVWCPTARANRREVLRRFAFISLLASVWTPCMQTILLPF